MKLFLVICGVVILLLLAWHGGAFGGVAVGGTTPITPTTTQVVEDKSKVITLQTRIGSGTDEIKRDIERQHILEGSLSPGRISWNDKHAAVLALTKRQFEPYLYPQSWADLQYVLHAAGFDPPGAYRVLNHDSDRDENSPRVSATNIIANPRPALDVVEKRTSRGFRVAKVDFIDTADTGRFGALDFGSTRIYWAPETDQIIVVNNHGRADLSFGYRIPDASPLWGAAEDTPFKWRFDGFLQVPHADSRYGVDVVKHTAIRRDRNGRNVSESPVRGATSLLQKNIESLIGRKEFTNFKGDAKRLGEYPGLKVFSTHHAEVPLIQLQMAALKTCDLLDVGKQYGLPRG